MVYQDISVKGVLILRPVLIFRKAIAVLRPIRLLPRYFCHLPYQRTKMTATRSLSFSSHTISSSPSFQSVFNAALDEYTKHTKNDLTSHPLSIKLDSCRSPDDVLGVLQEQAKVFREFREGNKKLMKVIEPTVNVLYSLSGVISDNIGLVRHKLQAFYGMSRMSVS